MKRFLSILLTLMLVFTLSSAVVLAEPEEQEEVTALPEQPEGFDESTIEEYLFLDLTNPEEVILSVYMTANDPTLDYALEFYKYIGVETTEINNNEKRTLVIGENKVTLEELNTALGSNADFAKINEKNIFADVSHYVLSIDPANYAKGSEDGELIVKIVVKFGNEEKSLEFVGGGESAYMVTRYFVNWVNVLIAVMCLAVLILLVVIIVLSKKKKNKQNAEENTEENVISKEIATENAEEVADSEVLEQDETIQEVENVEVVETVDVEETEEVAEETAETENIEEN